MVFHKRLVCGSNGFQVPQIPLPKSAKGKRSVRQKLHDKSNISAFDLLATVAGELLSEQENSPPPMKIIKQEKLDSEIPLTAKDFDKGSCNESTLHSEFVFFKPQIPKSIEKIGGGLIVDGKRNEKAIDENVPMDLDLDAKPPPLVSSDSSVEVPISRNGSFHKSRDEMGLLLHGDNDENSSGCTHPNIVTTKSFWGDRRIRKILASKFMKAPRILKDGEVSNAEMKPIYRNRKMSYTRKRTQRSPFKRRKSFERRSISLPSIGGISTEGGIKIVSKANGETGTSSSSREKSSYESGDYHVKLNIKSFKVPELFIEIPETATVGSLKRTVMEAVTAILAGGLRVGVLLQGKKIRDDKQTLVQAGISHNNKIENLGFSLEPNSTQTPLPSLTSPENPNPLLPSNPQLACPSIEPVESVLDQVPPKAEPEPFQTSTLIGPESDHDSVRSHTDASSSVDKASDSKALAPAPGTKLDTLPVVPLRKSRQSELVQRRIRRPFSVTEVEALVHAVEKLGTGRWRDVKIRAFDNAKHRTYVDLKDKWKTLVHTATISPQQRRGQPVPQQLLDRVLAAHSYWTQQHAKPSQLEPCFLI